MLRRSCRRAKNTQQTDGASERLKNNPDDELPSKKRAKNELGTKIKLEVQHDCPRQELTDLEREAKSTGLWHVETKACQDLVPDGTLEVASRELDLERTLLGGQSFRWSKEEGQTGLNEPIFTGTIKSYALQLWRCDQSHIAFRVLNRPRCNDEQDDIKPPNIDKVLEDYFQLEYKLEDLYRQWSANDKHLAKCCDDYVGFRILRQDPVENVFSFICATNNNIKRITQMIDKLCKKFGETIQTKCSSSVNFHRFPTVERLAEDDVLSCLRNELGFGYRAKFISATAKQLVELSEQQATTPREILLSFRKLPYKDTCKQLMQFNGIGRKVADCICLMSMDHLCSVPIDCHIYEIVCRNYMPKLRQERKTLTEGVHDLIGDYFKELHGPLAGWSTSVLFVAELKHLKKKLTKPRVPAKELKTKP